MTLTPYPLEGFGGINLSVDPVELGFNGAIDALNIDLDRLGRVRSRDGYDEFIATKSPTTMTPFYKTDGTRQLLIGIGGTTGVEVYNTAGTLVTSHGFTAASKAPGFARAGTPGSEKVYISNGEDDLVSWDGTAFATIAPAVLAGRYLAVHPADGRLASAVIVNPLAFPSRVHFSNQPTTSAPSAVETFGADDYVELAAGDGEVIKGMVAWQNDLYVFKGSKFFVFYGQSEGRADDGSVITNFNYRTVDTGIGAVSDTAICAGRDGVYFLDKTGLYRTTGGPPTLLSFPVDPIFSGRRPAAYGGGVADPARLDNFASVFFFDDRVYVAFTGTGASTNNYTLVYDPRLDSWTLYDLKARMFSSFAITGTDSPELLFRHSSGGIMRYGPAYTTDDGVAIPTRYQTGFSDFGSPVREKTIRETEVVGTGTVSVDWTNRFDSVASGQNVTLGSSVPERKLQRRAEVGELLSLYLSGSSPYVVHRIVPMLREAGKVGVR